MAEDYVRPPIVALERPNYRVATWRFRFVVLLILAVIAVTAFLIGKAVINSGENGSAQGGARTSVSAMALPLRGHTAW